MTLTPSDINRIFETDPLHLTTDDLDALIAVYRERRTQYKAGIKAEKTPKAKQSLSLDDLGDLKI